MTEIPEQSLKHEYLYDGGPCVSSCAACAEDTLKDDDEVFSAEGQGVGALVDADTLKPCPKCDRKLCQGCVDRADFPDHNTIPEGYEIVPSEEVLPPSTWTAWKLRKIAESTPEQIVEYQRHLMDATREAERDRIVALIRDMMRDHDIEGTTGYLFTGDQWNDETAEDIIGVIERGGLHV